MQDGEQDVRGAILGLLAVAHHFLSICLHFPYHLLINCYMCERMTRFEGSHVGVAGGCLPFPYHLLTLSLPVAFYLLHVQDGGQDVMDLVFPEHVMEFPHPPRRELFFIIRSGFLIRFSGGS